MRKLGGWTLKETLIVLGLIVALAALLLPLGLRMRTAARRAECRTQIATLGALLAQEYSQKGSLPITQREFEALAKRAGISPRCPINGESYRYYAAFRSPYDVNGNLLPDTPQLRHEWRRFILTLLQRPYHPVLQCETCYAPQLSNKISKWEWSGTSWYPVFSDDVQLGDIRYLGVNLHGCVDYYSSSLLGSIITARWDCRSGYNPFEEWGGSPLTHEEIEDLEQAIRQGGGSVCW